MDTDPPKAPADELTLAPHIQKQTRAVASSRLLTPSFPKMDAFASPTNWPVALSATENRHCDSELATRTCRRSTPQAKPRHRLHDTCPC
jgi:hypothetical protein